jgi:hypothetical protein
MFAARTNKQGLASPMLIEYGCYFFEMLYGMIGRIADDVYRILFNNRFLCHDSMGTEKRY